MIYLDHNVIGPWVSDGVGATWVKDEGTAIGWVKNGELVAGVIYQHFNKANVFCHIRGEGNWANRTFLRVIFDYPFNQLKVNRITAMIGSDNEASKKLVTHMGFELECTLAQANPSGDLLVYRMFRENCKYLRKPDYVKA